jgi:uncharacterized protein YbjT (DUF2867 family)
MKTTSILLAGATGNLGRLIAQNLLQNPSVQLSVLVRNANSASAQSLQQQGANLLEADLNDQAALQQPTRGQQVVISALSGGPDVLINGQLNLLEAARQNGVERFVASDYSSDFTKLDYGDNVNMDMRKRVMEAIQQSGIGYTVFLNGGFTEVVTSAFFGVVDEANRTVTYWGDGQQPLDLTTLSDTARYIADAVLDPATLNQVVSIAGDEISAATLADTLTEHTGEPFEQVSLGTTDELAEQINAIRQQNPANVFAYVFHQYKHGMFSGKGKLTKPIRQQYDGTPFVSFRSFLQNRDQHVYQLSF